MNKPTKPTKPATKPPTTVLVALDLAVVEAAAGMTEAAEEEEDGIIIAELIDAPVAIAIPEVEVVFEGG